ncbi:antibiotic biosynthesis monooxygenase [Couchioplanes caeruleus]|uniref:antibiotic biosynthesis monooxygenase family protein n=1 Tax=Couchioplanes caeruleus TaxID=56438 RepID=UPI0020C049FB|nr:antibiotic biosynthesis monooxygenase [Couchioplanes caeruleus]UQU61326.1 antibiotic biosynthesis monooxygenase [Couchioplanes caeruleus]
MPETTIAAGKPGITAINIYTVAETRQNALVTALDKATTDIFAHVPGFISANVHASLDRTRVVNYAQWTSLEAYEEMLRRPEVREHLLEVMSIAHTADPRLYTVRSVHRP